MKIAVDFYYMCEKWLQIKKYCKFFIIKPY